MFILCKFVKLQTQPHGIDVIDGKTGFELLVPVSHMRKVKTKNGISKKQNGGSGRRKTYFRETENKILRKQKKSFFLWGNHNTKLKRS